MTKTQLEKFQEFTTTNHTAARNPEEKEESYFQSYYIIIFKTPSFQEKNYKACRKTRKYVLFMGKIKPLEIISEAQTWNLLDKAFKLTVLNMLKVVTETQGKN